MSVINPVCPQVYVRRSYTAYDVTCVQHEMLDENTTIVQWQFLLPTSHPNRWGVVHGLCLCLHS